MCRRVARTWARVFSPALLLQRLHLPPPPFNDVVDRVFALRFLVFTKLWSLEALQEVVPEHRLANAVQHVAQGFVSMISFDGSVHKGAIVGSVHASMKTKLYKVVSTVVEREAQVPSCECVTGYRVWVTGCVYCADV